MSRGKGSRRSGGARSNGGAADSGRGPQRDASGQPPEGPGRPESAMRQAALARQAEPRKKTYAPLWAGAIVVVAVLAVIAYSLLAPKDKLTVAALKSPTVAALGAGDGLYAPNSKEGMTEVVKFGYLPAVELGQTSDGTVVVADPQRAQADMGLAKPLAQTSLGDFTAAKISPRKGAQSTNKGTAVTFEQALGDLGDSTVFVPELDSASIVAPFLTAIDKHGRADATIVRSQRLSVLALVKSSGKDAVATMYEYPDSGRPSTPAEAKAGGATMAAVPADAKNLDEWLKSGLTIWATGVKDKNQLDSLAGKGVKGALAHNPFTVQPSAVKTD